MNIADELTKLAALRDSNILSESEFQLQKTRLLQGVSQPAGESRRAEGLDAALMPILGSPGVRLLQKDPAKGTATIQTLYVKPVNHVVHLLLSVLTGGIWIVVWIFLAIDSKKGTAVTERITAADDGRIQRDVIGSGKYMG